MQYPKINSLYMREFTKISRETGEIQYFQKGKNKLILGEYSCPEFKAIDDWTVTEKIDGTNIRIILDREANTIKIKGRTEDSDIPKQLLDYLTNHFTFERLDPLFKDSKYTIFFGEGIGPKIQSGGYYCSEQRFILFDVCCSGWWLLREDVEGIAEKLEVPVCKRLPCPGSTDNYIWKKEQIETFVREKHNSPFAKDPHVMEGLVARSEPLMIFRRGGPIMFKLKCVDF